MNKYIQASCVSNILSGFYRGSFLRFRVANSRDLRQHSRFADFGCSRIEITGVYGDFFERDIAVILVTGGAGFIGSNLVDRLLESNHCVRVLDNLSSGRIENLENAHSYFNKFNFINGDINDSSSLANAMCGVSAVVHLAAQVSVQSSIQDPLNSASVNILGFLNVLEACRKFGVQKVVYASSAAVYGHPLDTKLNESSEVAPISPYGLEKATNEHYAALYERIYGLSCIGLRFFNVYGPRQDPNSSYAGVISKFLINAINGIPLKINGDGSQTRDFVHVYDVSKFCESALCSPYSGVICVGTGRSVTINQLTESIEEVVGKPIEVIHGAPVVGDILMSAMSSDKSRKVFGHSANISLLDGLQTLWLCMKNSDSFSV